MRAKIQSNSTIGEGVCAVSAADELRHVRAVRRRTTNGGRKGIRVQCNGTTRDAKGERWCLNGTVERVIPNRKRVVNVGIEGKPSQNSL